MKTIIIYKSATGFTEKYAKWIAEELNAETVSWKNRRKVKFADYDKIIYGSRFFAEQIDGLKWFKKQTACLTDKKTAVFVTGASPVQTEETKIALNKNISPEEQKNMPVFYIPGGLCYERMNRMEKSMMSFFCKMLEKTEGNSEKVALLKKSYDMSSKENITPLIEAMR